MLQVIDSLCLTEHIAWIVKSEKTKKDYNHTVTIYIYIDKRFYTDNEVISKSEFLIENIWLSWESTFFNKSSTCPWQQTMQLLDFFFLYICETEYIQERTEATIVRETKAFNIY